MKQNNKTEGKKKPNIKLYVIFALTVILIFGLYRVVLNFVMEGMLASVWFTALMWTYLALACICFIAIVILNRGVSGAPLTADQLPVGWDHIKKAEYMESDRKRRRIAKYLLIPCVAFIGVFIYEIAELYYAPVIMDWWNSF